MDFFAKNTEVFPIFVHRVPHMFSTLLEGADSWTLDRGTALPFGKAGSSIREYATSDFFKIKKGPNPPF